MDPFNIIIQAGSETIDLNIHPQEAGSYKVIYHGALIGEVFLGTSGWEAVTAEMLQPGGFPVYEYDENSGHEKILLSDDVVQAIGIEIAKASNGSAM